MTAPGKPQGLPDPEHSGPTVLRIVLGTQLRRMREAQGITREQAGDHIRASHAKISRLELGRVGFKERDIADLLTLYGVTDERERGEFMDLVAQANVPGWWHQYGDLLPSWFEMYLRLEQAASVIRTFQVQFVPGLLQSEDYARSVIVVGHQGESVEEIDRRVHLRMTRQKLLGEPGAPAFWAVIDEGALRRPFGPPRVMRGQIDHLLEMTELPNVTVQVLPFTFGGHAAAGGPFTILRFAEPDLPDIVYLEQLTSAVYLEKRPEVEAYLAVMERVSVQAETPARSAEMLHRLRRGL
ncbi:helix-turn-helix domain-containing protein [Pseudonocardia benzenivorans]|uniref:Helix-turn-helix domain protein n=2 Tax=Pseudonocardia TaxID=1847 RepID=F4D0X8_PSEUX|nr:Scr1 family TA system antitoxin-like transcriptional regulator [Pseudonocardia dioxanivorans]AEA25830.1 helix-turn-helix domain protein [Pseudonocardia dioxanivorans CB1190]GJF06410.1 transcriptional regulator [Pseudonocardia sp. D17]